MLVPDQWFEARQVVYIGIPTTVMMLPLLACCSLDILFFPPQYHAVLTTVTSELVFDVKNEFIILSHWCETSPATTIKT